MDIGRLLRRSAALPLRAASAGVNTTANITTAAVLGGVALATVPVRSAASLVSGSTDIESPAQVVAEFLGGKPPRRCSRGRGRVWIEVRGLNDPRHGCDLGRAVLESVRAQAGVASAVLNHPLSRLVVSTRGNGPSVRTLCDLVAAAEKQSADARPARPIDLPGDPMVLAGRLVALTANARVSSPHRPD